MNEELTNKLIELARWIGQDPDVRTMIAATCAKHGVATVGVLAQENPDLVIELYETAKDLREQAPPEEMPGFLR